MQPTEMSAWRSWCRLSGCIAASGSSLLVCNELEFPAGRCHGMHSIGEVQLVVAVEREVDQGRVLLQQSRGATISSQLWLSMHVAVRCIMFGCARTSVLTSTPPAQGSS